MGKRLLLQAVLAGVLGLHLGAAAQQMSEGETGKVDKDAKKITVRHGQPKNLEMPPMTMVFRVQGPALLDTARQGDKVSFVAEKVGGRFSVTRIAARR